MKKSFLGMILLLGGAFLSSQEFNIPKITYGIKAGENVSNIVDGKVIYAEKDLKKVLKSSMNISEELADGVVVVEYEELYYFGGDRKSAKFQVLISNVIPDSKYEKCSKRNGIEVKARESVGKAKGDVSLVIRSRNLDPHLVLCAKAPAVEEGQFWYYGLESMSPTIAKYLTFQPINSADDKIAFPDGESESINHIVKSPKADVVYSFPVMPVKFKASMKSYPVAKHEITESGEKILHDQFFSNMNLETVVDFDGIKVHLYFPENFAEYFKEEYKLGNPIWFYGNMVYVYKNELHVYGRDFVITDPDEIVNQKQNYFIQLNRQRRSFLNGKNPVKEDDYVDVTQTVPKGGYEVYERFFIKDQKSSSGFREKHGNDTLEYFDKNGKRVARMFFYNDTDMIRNTQTYKYDKKGRIIEYCNYDSYMYMEGKVWKVDQKRSRLFNKSVTEYNDTADGYEGITTEYRYSYKPKVEHLEKRIVKQFNKNGVLLKSKEEWVSSGGNDSVSEYDEKGNVIYESGFGERKYEYKCEYVYDGEKIAREKRTDLISGEVTETSFEYDEKGNLISRKNKNRTTVYKYNSKGKVLEATWFDKDGKQIRKETRRYDKKTGMLLFNHEEEIFGEYALSRFWYYELSKKDWKKDLTPEKILEKLPE